MTRVKLDTPAFADQSVDSRNIADGAVQDQDITGLVTGTQLAGSITNDKLVNNKVTVFSPIKKKFYKPQDVFDQYGLYPHNFITMKCLMGDKSDNLPGVKGLGPKKLMKFFPEIAGKEKFKLQEASSPSQYPQEL